MARWRRPAPAQAVTLVLEDEIDISRGDVLVHPDHRPSLARTFDAHLIWMSDTPLLPGKRYEFKIGTATSGAWSRRSSTASTSTT